MVQSLVKIEQNFTDNRAKVGKCKSAFGPVFYISKWLSARPRIDPNRPRRVKNTRKHATKTHAKKSNGKKLFFIDLGVIWGSQNDPQNHKNGCRASTFCLKVNDCHWLFDFLVFFYNFGDVGTHNEAKMVPNPEKSSFWHTLPALFRKNEVFSRRVCVTARSLTHTLHVKTSFFRKSAGRVCQNQAQNRLFLENTS